MAKKKPRQIISEILREFKSVVRQGKFTPKKLAALSKQYVSNILRKKSLSAYLKEHPGTVGAIHQTCGKYLSKKSIPYQTLLKYSK